MLGRGRWATWSVGAHLSAIAFAVVVAALAVGVYSSRTTLDGARRGVEADSRALAGLAAGGVASNIAIGRQQVAALAANPAIPDLIADPAQCQLAFDLDLFPKSHLDLVRADGQVRCSSSPAAQDAVVELGWMVSAQSTDGVVERSAVADGSTDDPAVLFAAPVSDANGDRVGAVVLVVPTASVASGLADSYGGPRNFQFTLVDGDEHVLSSSVAGAGNRIATGAFIHGAAAIDGTSWTAFAGVGARTGLGPARRAVARGVMTVGAMLLVLLVSLAILYRRIVRPLRKLTAAVSDRGAHVDGVLGAIGGPSEIVRLSDEFRAAIAARDDYEERLAHQALHDPLTGLPNRALLAERLGHSLEQLVRSGRNVGVLFLDLDRFKFVNDSLGHTIGDEVLSVTATRLQQVLRAGDTLSRFGGDEFVIVGEGFATNEEAEGFADRLLAAVAAPIEVSDTIVRVTASIGIAVGSAGARGVDLVRDADAAMYVAKEHGGSRHEMFDDALRTVMLSRLTIENELRVALERHELHLVYQPKVDLRTGATIGVEALLRWDHPALGSIPPVVFIPIAEETGLIVPIGQFVIQQSCAQVAAWSRDGIDVPMAVNLSPRQLRDAGLEAHVAESLETAGVAPSRLCLELTESVLMGDVRQTARTLSSLHAMGVQLSIDDFGTGYSSLAHLRRFPVDELKIDRAFVRDLTDHAEQRSLVAAIVAMAAALELRVVAEGVETAEQATLLVGLGCHLGQGYHFAVPQPAHALTARLAQDLARHVRVRP